VEEKLRWKGFVKEVGFKPWVKEWGSYRRREWRIRRSRWCDRCMNRWIRDRETGMRLTESLREAGSLFQRQGEVYRKERSTAEELAAGVQRLSSFRELPGPYLAVSTKPTNLKDLIRPWNHHTYLAGQSQIGITKQRNVKGTNARTPAPAMTAWLRERMWKGGETLQLGWSR